MALLKTLGEVRRQLGRVQIRTISSVQWKDTTAYNSKPEVKNYVEARIKQMCAANGQDAAGADVAIVIGTVHEGGTNRAETLHVGVKLKTPNGTALKHPGPTGILVKTLHMRLDADQTTFDQNNPEHPGYHHCTSVLGQMIVRGKEGPHICFIFQPMGDLQLLEQPSGAFPLLVTKKVIKQTLLALDYIHTDCGLVHTDLKLSNVFVSLGDAPAHDMDEQIRAYLRANPSETYEPRVYSTLSSEPIITVKSQPLPNFGLNPDFSNLRIKLGDFGVALNLTSENLSIGRNVQPNPLKAPEILLGHAWSTPIDIWALGCMVFQCLVTKEIFENRLDPDELAYAFLHMLRMMQLLGPFPQEFLARCTMRQQYFDENGDLLYLPKVPSKTLEECLDNYKSLKTEELRPAANFIRRCLTIDPLARPTAKELLKDEWLKDV